MTDFIVLGSPPSKMAATTIIRPRDPNTLSNYTAWRSRHVTANLEIDFDNKRLAGNVIHQLLSKTKAETKEIILDTSFLDILSVKVGGKAAQWELLPRFEPFGSALKIYLESGVDEGVAVDVDVRERKTYTVLQAEMALTDPEFLSDFTSNY